MEVAKGIHHFDSGAFNWYIIEERGRLTLVDAGFPGHYKVYEQGLKTLGKTNKDIEAIVLTHGHADHIGFAERVRKDTGVPVYVHLADAIMACKPLQLPWWGLISNAWRPNTLINVLGHALMNGVFTLPHLTKVQPVKHGQVLDIPGRPLILHTPGHTEGEISLMLEDRKILLAGDTINTRNLLSGEYGGPQIASPKLSKDYGQNLRSLDLLRELGEVTLLTGHGKPWKGYMNDAVELALGEAKYRT
jgi:glyoxylase-like metal-dependent hydrolase (beta-lactamase superfamily II)